MQPLTAYIAAHAEKRPHSVEFRAADIPGGRLVLGRAGLEPVTYVVYLSGQVRRSLYVFTGGVTLRFRRQEVVLRSGEHVHLNMFVRLKAVTVEIEPGTEFQEFIYEGMILTP
jgi:hypothetical protein